MYVIQRINRKLLVQLIKICVQFSSSFILYMVLWKIWFENEAVLKTVCEYKSEGGHFQGVLVENLTISIQP